MTKEKATATIGLRVTPSLKERIDKRADEENRTSSNFVIHIVTEYLDKIDDAKKLLSK